MQELLNKINLLGGNTEKYLTPLEKVMEFIKIFVTTPMIVPLIMVLSLFLVYEIKGKNMNKIKLPIFIVFMALVICLIIYEKYSNILAIIFFFLFLFLIFYTIITCIIFISKMINKKEKKKIKKTKKTKKLNKKIVKIEKVEKKIQVKKIKGSVKFYVSRIVDKFI